MVYDSKKAVKDYLKTNAVYGLDRTNQLISVAKLIAQIPWGEGRNIKEVFLKKVGTCTGKHLLLQACFNELEIKCIPVVCTFKWGEQSIEYPENLKAILRESEWDHGHNFVQVKAENGQYLDIDITWNSTLKPYGFKTFPRDWNGKTSFIGIDNVIKRWDGVNIEKTKQKLVDSLAYEVRERRRKFLGGFINWINSINSNPSG